MKKLVIAVIGLIGVVFVCLILAVILLPVVDAPEPEVVVIEVASTPKPTARPKPTEMLETCLTLEKFEYLGSMVFTAEPDFKEVDTDEFEWTYFHDDGIYIINLQAPGGCVTRSMAIGLFNADYGDYEMLGELIGGMAGYFSDSSDEGLDWLFGDSGVAFNCETRTSYDTFKTMRDGTDWYLLCEIDSDNDMNMGVRIDQ